MNGRRRLMLAGFVAAFVGDWFLAVKGSPRASVGFVLGVAAFSAAQVFWMMAHVREARLDGRIVIAATIPLVSFFGVRLWPVLSAGTAFAVGAYALLSAFALAWALSTRRLWYVLGIALLLVSDLMIGCRWLRVPLAGELIGPLYITAELSLWTSFFLRDEKRLDFRCRDPFAVGLWTVLLSLAVFALAMVTFPGGCYNPCQRMLSALGRTEIRSVMYPACHFLFVLGMLIAVFGISRIAAFLVESGHKLGTAFAYGASLNVAGLLTIAAVPENVCVDVHNAGCWLAALGGAVMLAVWSWRCKVWAASRFCLVLPCLLLGSCLMLGLGLALHGLKVVGFAPWVPTAQKALILGFMFWFLQLAWPFRVGHR